MKNAEKNVKFLATSPLNFKTTAEHTQMSMILQKKVPFGHLKPLKQEIAMHSPDFLSHFCIRIANSERDGAIKGFLKRKKVVVHVELKYFS